MGGALVEEPPASPGTYLGQTPGIRLGKLPGIDLGKTPGTCPEKFPGIDVEKTPGTCPEKLPGTCPWSFPLDWFAIAAAFVVESGAKSVGLATQQHGLVGRPAALSNQ